MGKTVKWIRKNAINIVLALVIICVLAGLADTAINMYAHQPPTPAQKEGLRKFNKN
jgi:hypothetical protein